MYMDKYIYIYIYIHIYKHWYISICIYIYGYIHIYFCLLEPLPLLFSYLSNVFEKNSASLSCTEWKGKNGVYMYLLLHLAWVCPVQGSINAHKQKPLGHRAG